MGFYKLLFVEGKKLIFQRDIYIALFICTVLFWLAINSSPEPPSPFQFGKSLASVMPWIGYWFVSVLIVVGIARCLPFEREQGMEELIHTYKKGRLHLLVVKQVTLLVYCALVVIYFYLLAIAAYAMQYDTGGLFAQVRMAESPYVSVNPSWTFAQLLLYEYGYLVLAAYIFALSILFLSFIIKRSVFIIMIAGGSFAAGEIFYFFLLRYIGTMEISKYLYFINRYGFNGMLGFNYLDSLTVNYISAIQVYGLFAVIIVLLFLLNLAAKRWMRHVAVGD